MYSQQQQSSETTNQYQQQHQKFPQSSSIGQQQLLLQPSPHINPSIHNYQQSGYQHNSYPLSQVPQQHEPAVALPQPDYQGTHSNSLASSHDPFQGRQAYQHPIPSSAQSSLQNPPMVTQPSLKQPSGIPSKIGGDIIQRPSLSQIHLFPLVNAPEPIAFYTPPPPKIQVSIAISIF